MELMSQNSPKNWVLHHRDLEKFTGDIQSPYNSDTEAMNKIGKLLRDEPILGRVMASKNHLKRKTGILEGSKARVESHNVGLSLIAAELVICLAGLYHLLNGWSGPESPFNFSDIRLFIPA
jgi:hypothetical protein